MEQPSHTGLEVRRSWIVIAVAVIVTGIFHTIVFEHGSLAFALFALAAVIGIHVIVIASGKRGNRWAYIFLAPLLLSIATLALYASPGVHFVGAITLLLSLGFFAYWFASPVVPYKGVRTLWPWPLFLESVLPFHRFSRLFVPVARGQSQWKRIALGAALAIPFLGLFALLFVNSDLFLEKTIADTFASFRPEEWIQRIIADAIVLLFFLGAGWTAMTRLVESRQAPAAEEHAAYNDHVLFGTFLGLLNLLFLAFVVFQFVYFFGGEAIIQARGITYADYAREGFFQLLAVALIVFLLVAILHRFHAMRHWLTATAAGALIIQTGIISVSAIRRMLLYIDTYGLTLSRTWALVAIILTMIALAVMLIAIIVKWSFPHVAAGLFIWTLFAVACVNALNIGGFVTRVNVDRFLSGETTRLDHLYLANEFSSDAIPALVRAFSLKSWPPREDVSVDHRLRLGQYLRYHLEQLRGASVDWRNMTVSDYQALGALTHPSVLEALPPLDGSFSHGEGA